MKRSRLVWHSLTHLGSSLLLLSGCGGNASANRTGGEPGRAGSGTATTTFGSNDTTSTSSGSSLGGNGGGGAAMAANNSSTGPGGASSAASSSAGAGGASSSAPPSKVINCDTDSYDLDDVIGYGTADEKREYTGVNGTFVDHCVDGNLIDYACEILGGDFPTTTGEVIFDELDCSGRCQDGTCPDPCLRGATLRYVSVSEDGIHVVTNVDNGWSYQCELISDDEFCGSLEPGAEMHVVFGPEFQCTSDVIGEIAVGSTPGTAQCYYENCVVLAVP